jgi:uncharacterized membrane protein SirB2
MLKRNLSSILVIIAMALIILGYDFSNNLWSKKFFIFIGALIVLMSSLISIIMNKSKKKE